MKNLWQCILPWKISQAWDRPWKYVLLYQRYRSFKRYMNILGYMTDEVRSDMRFITVRLLQEGRDLTKLFEVKFRNWATKLEILSYTTINEFSTFLSLLIFYSKHLADKYQSAQRRADKIKFLRTCTFFHHRHGCVSSSLGKNLWSKYSSFAGSINETRQVWDPFSSGFWKSFTKLEPGTLTLF